jgi:hypothetical protein
MATRSAAAWSATRPRRRRRRRVFTWSNGKLAANVPPGQFASVCSFAPGHYAYTAQKVGHSGGAGNPTGVLPAKGNIEVQ